MSTKKMLLGLGLTSFASVALYFQAHQQQRIAQHESLRECDHLYVLSPHDSKIWGDGTISFLDENNHEIEKLVTEKTADGKYRFLRMEKSNQEIFRFPSNLKTYAGSMVNNGFAGLPKLCPKISVLDARNPENIRFAESMDPANLEN